jgi:cytochrome c-type biogenesis protein CcmH/NrfG
MDDAIRRATDPKMNRPDLLTGAAEILISAGHNLPQAELLLRRYLSSGATVEDAPVFKAHYLLGTILERAGDKQAAAEQYREALSLAKNFSPGREALKRMKQEPTGGVMSN